MSYHSNGLPNKHTTVICTLRQVATVDSTVSTKYFVTTENNNIITKIGE